MLRGIACMLVALMHITITFSETCHQPLLGNIFKFGGSGVDIFFVLSGFIITYSNMQYIAKAASAGKFLIKRAIRIFPIYWIIISIFLLLQLLLPSFYRTHFQLTATTIISTYLLLPNHEMINGVSWSLTNELFFYIIFTLAILIPIKKYSLSLLLVFFIVLFLFPLTSFNTSNKNEFTKLLIFPMNIEFLFGISVVLLINYFPKKWCIPCLITGIGLFILSALFFNNGYSRVLMYGFPSFLIILALVKYELTFDIKVNKLFLQLGDASYSIYLFHLPIVVAFYKIMGKLNVTNHLLTVILSLGLFFFICLMGIFIYKKIESPLIKCLNRALV